MLEAALIVLFTLFFLYIAWWKLDWAITLCIVFLPAYLLRFQVWFLPMTILEVMVLAVFLIWIIRTFTQDGMSFREQCKSIWWPWRWLTLLFVLSGLAALFISPDLRAAGGLWKAYILEPVIFFIVFVNVIKSKHQVHQVLWALGTSAVLVGFVTMLQYLEILQIPAHYGSEIPPRATSVFPFPTAVGKFLGPILGLFAGILFVRGLKTAESLWAFVQRNIFIVGVTLFSLMGLLFSVSRGALIGVFVALIVASFFSRWRKWILSALFIVVIVAFLIPAVRSNITSVFSATDVSTDVRIVMWKGAWRIIQDNPLTGTGLASFPVVYEDYKEASHTEFFPNPDHLILTLWIEMGIAGLLVFMVIVIKYFRTAIQLLRQNREIAVGLIAAMVVILVHGFFDTPYFKNDLAIEFWVLIGLAVTLSRPQIVKKRPTDIITAD